MTMPNEEAIKRLRLMLEKGQEENNEAIWMGIRAINKWEHGELLW